MTAALLITFRETLEASLVVGIVLAVLSRFRRHEYSVAVWSGVAAGVAVSLLFAVIVRALYGELSGSLEAAFEGLIMLAAAALVTWMVLWLSSCGRAIHDHVSRQATDHVLGERPRGIFLLTFFSVLREGAETVLFLQAAVLQSRSLWQGVGALAGIALAVVLGVLFYRGLRVISLRRVFSVSGFLLLLFAAGLAAHGVHELQEAGWISLGAREIWNVNPPLLADGSYPLLHDKGVVGSLLAGLFGYNGNPSVLEFLTYVAYLSGVTVIARRPHSSLLARTAAPQS